MSRAASNGRFDLDKAAAAAAAENKPVPFQFTYKGAEYEIPPATDWPLEAQALIGAGELERAMIMLLGQDAYSGLLKAGITMGELSVLFEAVGDAAGVGGLPNLSPPAPVGSART